MGHYQDMLKANRAPTAELKEHIGETYEGFAQMYRSAFADGALSPATKELIATAIAISDECEGCIASHVRGAVRHGVTEEEFAEMVSVVILMNGGPGTIYGPKAWSAYKEFKERYG